MGGGAAHGQPMGRPCPWAALGPSMGRPWPPMGGPRAAHVSPLSPSRHARHCRSSVLGSRSQCSLSFPRHLCVGTPFSSLLRMSKQNSTKMDFPNDPCHQKPLEPLFLILSYSLQSSQGGWGGRAGLNKEGQASEHQENKTCQAHRKNVPGTPFTK